jgi:hypothetical protein
VKADTRKAIGKEAGDTVVVAPPRAHRLRAAGPRSSLRGWTRPPRSGASSPRLGSPAPRG